MQLRKMVLIIAASDVNSTGVVRCQLEESTKITTFNYCSSEDYETLFEPKTK